MHRPTRPARAALVLTAAALALAACAPSVAVQAAPDATDPVCADVVLATPDELDEGLRRIDTTAQATTAWGSRTAAIVLRCGVQPPGPTTEHCQTVETPGGPSIDWVVVASDPQDENASDWTFTTYGRVPAVEVFVPAAVAAQHSSSAFMGALGPAVARTDEQRSCV